MEVEVGSIFDFVGKPFVPIAPGAWRYEPVVDERYEPERWRAEIAALELNRPDNGPGMPRYPLATTDAEKAAHPPDAARDALALRVRDETRDCWARFLAIGLVLDEAVQWFDEDAVVPESLVALLRSARAGLVDLRTQAEGVVEFGKLPDADPALLDELRLGLARADTIQL